MKCKSYSVESIITVGVSREHIYDASGNVVSDGLHWYGYEDRVRLSSVVSTDKSN
jgi:hypothetical protein